MRRSDNISTRFPAEAKENFAKGAAEVAVCYSSSAHPIRRESHAGNASDYLWVWYGASRTTLVIGWTEIEGQLEVSYFMRYRDFTPWLHSQGEYHKTDTAVVQRVLLAATQVFLTSLSNVRA